MTFVDDVARLEARRLEAQAGINMMENITETNLLSNNMDKSIFMVVGREDRKKKLE